MKDFKIKTISCLEKVMPNKMPTLNEKEGICLKNESFSFQVAYYNKTREWFSAFCNLIVNSDINEFIQIRYVENVMCQTPTSTKKDDYYLTHKKEIIPDILKDDSPLIIKLQTWQSIYVTIKGNLPIGKHTISFIIKDYDNNILGKTSYTLTVIDKELEKSNLYYSNWFHYDSIANYYKVKPFSKKYNTIMWNFIDNAINHGLNTLIVPLFTIPLDTAVNKERITCQLLDISYSNNTYFFNFDRLLAFMKTAKEKGIKMFEMAHLFTQWGASNAPKIIVKVNNKNKKMFGWKIKAEDEKYLDFLKQLLSKLIPFLKENGFDENEVIFHLSDEPNASHLNHYLYLKSVIKPLLKDYLICDALSNYEYYTKKAVDRSVVATNEAKPFILNNVDNFWVYYCCSQCDNYLSNRFISMPLLRCRIIGMQLYLTNAKGLLHWGYNFYNSALSKRYINPYLVNDADGMFQSGDSFIAYPKDDGTCYDSIRHETIYNAFLDYRLLITLEKKIGRNNVIKLLKKNGFECDFTTYPKDEKLFIELRKKIILML